MNFYSQWKHQRINHNNHQSQLANKTKAKEEETEASDVGEIENPEETGRTEKVEIGKRMSPPGIQSPSSEDLSRMEKSRTSLISSDTQSPSKSPKSLTNS